LKPGIDDVNCPQKDGFLDLSVPAAADGTAAAGGAPAPVSSIVCPVKGKNLDKVTRLRLRDAKESMDTTIADGTMKIAAGDSTQGTVTFSLSDVKALTGDTYNVFWMDKTNVEQPTGQVLKLAPVLSSVNPAELSKATVVDGGILTLRGTNLNLVTGVQLSDSNKKLLPTQPTLTILPNDGKTLTLTYKKSEIGSLADGTYSIVLVVNGKPLSTASNVTLTVSK
jgi:hypothetical protein